MSTVVMTERIAGASPRLKAKIAGAYYLLNIVTGALALFASDGWRSAAVLVAASCYIVVTLLFYDIFRPVNRRLSMLAAFFSLVGCASSALDFFHLALPNPLVFFGFYCLLIGYLIFRSTFLPRILGVLMAIGGLGWLTFLSPTLAKYLSPYNLAPGILGELSLTLWLLVTGVNVERWKEQANAASNRRGKVS